MALTLAQAKPPTISSVGVARPNVTLGATTQARPPQLLSPVQNFVQSAQTLLAQPKATAPTPPPVVPMAPAVVKPPALDLAALQAKARADAEGAVNPYYTKLLNDFLTQQSAQKAQQQAQYDTNIKNLDDQLAETLKTNEITGKRTTEDVGQNMADINQNADIFQTDSGQAADAARIAQARGLAQSGLTGGVGAQQQEAATAASNTGEKRQEQQFQHQRQAQELFKTRTFEDLARSGELATKSTEKGKKAAKFDLDSFIEGQGFNEQNQRSSLEQQRLGAVQQEQGNRAKLALNEWLAKIRDPAQLLAASQIYGGAV